MTNKQVVELMATISVYYPRFQADEITVKAWHKILEGENFAEVQDELKRFILSDEKGFPPTVGQLVPKRKGFKNFREHRYNYKAIEKQLLNTRPIGIGTTKTEGGKDGT